jgi:hypothetical protein
MAVDGLKKVEHGKILTTLMKALDHSRLDNSRIVLNTNCHVCVIASECGAHVDNGIKISQK